MLDGRDLRIIVTVAEHGSLVKAGRVLGVSQSGLTRSLAQIEEKLGVALFGRSLLALGRPARADELLRYPLSVGTSLAGRYAAQLGRLPGAAAGFHAVMGSTLHVSLSLAAQSDACVLAPAAGARLFHDAGLLLPLPCEVDWPATNFGIIWLKHRLLDATAKALIERMKAADEAAFRYGQSLPAALLREQPGGYAVAGARHAPASPEKALRE